MDIIQKRLGKFFHSDSAVGTLLFMAALAAILMENSSQSGLYHDILHFKINVSIGELQLDHDLHYWVNDALMVLFFLMVGLEIKREFITGQLSNINYVILPTVAALGGILVPAVVFLLFNLGTEAINGWAIPAATDIAFALGVIALFGKRLPSSFKLFILTLAVIDDIGAVFIIAAFYSGSIDMLSLFYVFVGAGVMASLNMANVRSLTPYMLIGLVTWFFMLKTGVHPTLVGIIIAACIPLKVAQDPKLPHAFGMDLGDTRLGYVSPAIKLEASLHRHVSFVILPLFAFMNAGVNLGVAIPASAGLGLLFSGVTAGVFWGLFLGKPIGIVSGAMLWKWVSRQSFPQSIDSLSIVGMGFICGIGFTMSILITTIGFAGMDVYINSSLVGVLLGSLLSGVAGSIILYYWMRRQTHEQDESGEMGEQKSASVDSSAADAE